jgi:hypothetical protein
MRPPVPLEWFGVQPAFVVAPLHNSSTHTNAEPRQLAHLVKANPMTACVDADRRYAHLVVTQTRGRALGHRTMWSEPSLELMHDEFDAVKPLTTCWRRYDPDVLRRA